MPSIDRRWLGVSSEVLVWVDLAALSIPESLILSDTFGFHPLSVEDAMSKLQYPKIEAYDGYLYIVLHGLSFRQDVSGFSTHDVDFFLGRNFLVTVHDRPSRSIGETIDLCPRNDAILGEGTVALFHRIVDRMVDRYLPEIEQLEDQIDDIEAGLFHSRTEGEDVLRRILSCKRDVSMLRRIAGPQRDVINRLARREFVDISAEMAFRFRDVYDHVVRVSDEALMLSDRLTGVLDAHLSNVSNRLNQVMKILTVLTTIFMPLTVLTGLYGMNVTLPLLPGGPNVQFWWILGLTIGTAAVMLAMFRRLRWI